MNKIVMGCCIVAASITAACSGTTGTETNSPPSQLALTMASAFQTVPAGTSDLNTSFVGDLGESFSPEFGMMDRGRLFGFGLGPGFGIGLMGGGLFGGFFGDDFGRGFSPMDTSCHYSATSGSTTCSRIRDGLTRTRVIQFEDAAGKATQTFDATTTNSVEVKITVTGTATRWDNDQSTINSSSDQTVSGLAKGSTSRTVNSTSSSSENTTGTSREGAFTSKRVASDDVKGVVIPFPTSTDWFPFPTAGSISRSISTTVQITGQSAKSSSRSEVITYDGSNKAKVVITQNDTTQNCTLPLPHGRLTCS